MPHILLQVVENKKTYELEEEEIQKLRDEVSKYTTEADLRRTVAQNIKRLKDIGSYRGRRHIMVSPVPCNWHDALCPDTACPCTALLHQALPVQCGACTHIVIFAGLELRVSRE